MGWALTLDPRHLALKTCVKWILLDGKIHRMRCIVSLPHLCDLCDELAYFLVNIVPTVVRLGIATMATMGYAI